MIYEIKYVVGSWLGVESQCFLILEELVIRLTGFFYNKRCALNDLILNIMVSMGSRFHHPWKCYVFELMIHMSLFFKLRNGRDKAPPLTYTFLILLLI
jgi:hypothetical protein